MVREAWLIDCIDKQELQPLESYDCISDRSAYGKGIPWDKQDSSEEAIESLTAEVTLRSSPLIRGLSLRNCFDDCL